MLWIFGAELQSEETIHAVSLDQAVLPDAIIEGWMVPLDEARAIPEDNYASLPDTPLGFDMPSLLDGLPHTQWQNAADLMVSVYERICMRLCAWV